MTAKRVEDWASWIAIIALFAMIGASFANAASNIVLAGILVGALALAVQVVLFIARLSRD